MRAADPENIKKQSNGKERCIGFCTSYLSAVLTHMHGLDHRYLHLRFKTYVPADSSCRYAFLSGNAGTLIQTREAAAGLPAALSFSHRPLHFLQQKYPISQARPACFSDGTVHFTL